VLHSDVLVDLTLKAPFKFSSYFHIKIHHSITVSHNAIMVVAHMFPHPGLASHPGPASAVVWWYRWQSSCSCSSIVGQVFTWPFLGRSACFSHVGKHFAAPGTSPLIANITLSTYCPTSAGILLETEDAFSPMIFSLGNWLERVSPICALTPPSSTTRVWVPVGCLPLFRLLRILSDNNPFGVAGTVMVLVVPPVLNHVSF
jgi:hypothetical protein